MPRPFRNTAVRFARDLQNWWVPQGKQQFHTVRRLAEAVGVGSTSFSRYLSGQRFPNPNQRRKLYEITGLDCFKSPVIQKHHPLKGTSEGSSQAPFAKDLNSWFESQDQFPSKAALARAAGFKPQKLLNYFAGRQFPDPKQPSRLYEVTKLDCFGPGAKSALALHRRLLRVKKPWVRDLLIEIHRFIDCIYPNTHERRRFYGYESKFIKEIERSEISQLSEIDHRKLIRFELEKKDKRRERWALGFFGRFFEAKGYWTADQMKKFVGLLSRMYERNHRVKRKPGVYMPSSALAQVLQELTINCGLHSKEIRSLRVGQIEQVGIRLGADRVIPFGTGPHMVTRKVFESWLAEAQPQDLIFYQRRPRDYSKPMGSDNLLEAVRQRHPSGDLDSVRKSHFDEDFRREKNLRKVRLHLTQFHCLKRARASGILRKLVQQSQYFVVPEPFLLAVLGASRLLPCQPQVLEGGRQCTAKWKSLLGRYDVTITWPTSFARQLQTIGLVSSRNSDPLNCRNSEPFGKSQKG